MKKEIRIVAAVDPRAAYKKRVAATVAAIKAAGPDALATQLNGTHVLKAANQKQAAATISLLPVVCCPGAAAAGCAGACYACHGRFLFETVLTSLARNFCAARYWPEIFWTQLERDCANYLRRRGAGCAVRVHTAGDFFNSSYAAQWTDFAHEFPKIKFFGYTKSSKCVNLDALWDDTPNFSLLNSMPCGAPNFGTADYVRALERILRARGRTVCVCPAVSARGKSVRGVCGVSCKYCYRDRQREDAVLFFAHGAAAAAAAEMGARALNALKEL